MFTTLPSASSHRVAEETETWLEQLEVSWAMSERVERGLGPAGRGPGSATRDAERRRTHAKHAMEAAAAAAEASEDDVESYLACVDKLAAAERFFSERRAYKASFFFSGI